MRRLTRIPAFAAAVLSLSLPVSAQAQRSAYGVDWSCGYEEGKVFVQRLKRASQEDLSCLVGAGFMDEALPRIGGRMDEDRQRLRMLLRLLVEQDPEAVSFFEEELSSGTDEAALWLLIANGEQGLQISDRRSRSVAVNLFISLPPWTREMYGSKLADALLAEGDTRAALTLATALRTIATRDEEVARAAMIQARVIEIVGSTDEAVALYQEASELGNDRLQAEADLRRIALMWRTGYITTDEAVVVLQELVTIWRGEDLGTGITLALARAYYFDQQLPQALRLLYSVAGSNAPEDVREEATRRIKVIAEDLFIRRVDPATIGDLMDVYELVRPLVAEPDAFWLGDLKLAEILVEVGLMARTERLMRNATPERVAAEGGNAALLSSAQLMIAFNDRASARAYLGALPRQSLSPEDRETFDLVEARALEIEDLPSLLQPGTRREVLAIVKQRAWNEDAYGLFAAASALSNDRPTWREPTAKYLARGDRLDREATAQNPDVRLKALSSAPKPSVYHADDLRPLLAPSAEVAGLASTLTQIGQELSEETSQSAPADEDAQARNERTR